MHMISALLCSCRLLWFRSPVPGPVMFRAPYDIFRCDAVLRFPRPRHRAGFRLWSYAVIWPMICCDDVLCSGIRRFEIFWCDAVAWRQRQAGDHRSKSLCMISICILYIRIPHRFVRLFLYLFLYPLTLIIIWITVPFALHTQYFFRTDPPFCGELRFMPRRYRRSVG